MSSYRQRCEEPRRRADRRLSRRALMQTGAAGIAAGALSSVPGVSPATAQDQEYGGEEVTITYGMWDATQQPAVESQIEAFNKQFPNITVEVQLAPYADYWTEIQTGIAGGETYDVFWLETIEFPIYASQGSLLPIEPVLGSGGIDPALYPQNLVDAYTWEGQIYGIPRDFDTIGLFYNTDLFDEAGLEYPTADWTWDNLRQAAEQLTVRDGDTVTRWGYAAVLTVYQGLFNFIHQNQGRILNEDLTQAMLNEPPACEAIRFLTDLYEQELTPTIAMQQATYPADGLFPAGQLAMMPGGSWYSKPFSEANPAIQVAPLPKGKQPASMIHGIGNGIWAGTQHQGAALEFVKFLGGEEAERILGETSTVIPAMEGMQQVWVDSIPEMNLQVFLDAVDHSHTMPAPLSGSEWQVNVEDVLIEAWSGNIPPDDVCDRATEAANSALGTE